MKYLLPLLLFIPIFLFATPTPENTLVLVNKNSTSSKVIAAHYIQKRGIPAENVIGLNLSKEESVSWDEFASSLYNPLKALLIEKGWLKAKDLQDIDPLGRHRYESTSHSIDFLVLTHGVPLKIESCPHKDPYAPNVAKELSGNYASVDSELSLLPLLDAPITSFVDNPLYKNKDPKNDVQNKVIRIARLDGPSRDAIKKLVDNAIFAETYGLQGKAYIQTSNRHPLGDTWLKSISKTLQDRAFDVTVNKDNQPFPYTQRFDAPAFYFGWWENSASGPFLHSGLKFPQGAIAVHIHSFSASTIRSTTDYWVGPLVEKGVTATVGNVYEPYLQLTHNLDLLTEALLAGKSWGEASYYSNPALSWQSVTIGDPLYTPFKKSLKEQLTAIDDNPSPYAQYAVMRHMNYLKRFKDIEKAIKFGLRYNTTHSGLALQLRIAEFMADKSDYESAIEALKFVEYIESYAPEAFMISKDIADFLYKYGNLDLSLTVYESLIDFSITDKPTRKYFLRKAIEVAMNAENHKMHDDWEIQFNELALESKVSKN